MNPIIQSIFKGARALFLLIVLSFVFFFLTFDGAVNQYVLSPSQSVSKLETSTNDVSLSLIMAFKPAVMSIICCSHLIAFFLLVISTYTAASYYQNQGIMEALNHPQTSLQANNQNSQQEDKQNG